MDKKRTDDLFILRSTERAWERLILPLHPATLSNQRQ